MNARSFKILSNTYSPAVLAASAPHVPYSLEKLLLKVNLGRPRNFATIQSFCARARSPAVASLIFLGARNSPRVPYTYTALA